MSASRRSTLAASLIWLRDDGVEASLLVQVTSACAGRENSAKRQSRAEGDICTGLSRIMGSTRTSDRE